MGASFWFEYCLLPNNFIQSIITYINSVMYTNVHGTIYYEFLCTQYFLTTRIYNLLLVYWAYNYMHEGDMDNQSSQDCLLLTFERILEISFWNVINRSRTKAYLERTGLIRIWCSSCVNSCSGLVEFYQIFYHFSKKKEVVVVEL